MEDLIKVATNGQWILEKAKMSRAEIEQAIAQFQAAKDKIKNTPSAPRPQQSTPGLRPAQHATGENPDISKEQLAALRAAIPANAEKEYIAAKQKAQSPQAKHIATSQKELNADQRASEEKAKVIQNKKAAWEATTKFLAQHGGEKESKKPEVMGQGYGYGTSTGGENKGWASLNQKLQTQKLLDQANATGVAPAGLKQKKELLPPMEMIRDAQGKPSMQQRQGKFHGQGATTRGKIVHTPVAYEDKVSGEKRYTNVPQQEEHQWGWDHTKQKWNHVKTIRVPTST